MVDFINELSKGQQWLSYVVICVAMYWIFWIRDPLGTLMRVCGAMFASFLACLMTMIIGEIIYVVWSTS